MRPAAPSDGVEDIAAQFAALMRALERDGKIERPPEIRHMLIDRLRDALDRRQARLSQHQAAFLANSFLVEETVYHGGRTEVIRLRHRDLATRHALKTLSLDHRDEAIGRDLLLREARIGMALRHPNLIETQIVLRLPDGRPAIIMDWAGEALSSRLSGPPLSVENVIDAMIALLRGLQAIHVAGYVHCDISPANLLLPEKGFHHLKIADFGVALEQGQRHGDLQIQKAVTPLFSAPEQSEDGTVDGRADLYSAGRVMLALLQACRGSAKDVEPLRLFALHLSQADRPARPPDAPAALVRLNNLHPSAALPRL